MALTAKELSGLEKASVLMMSLNASASAQVFEHLTVSEREILSAQIVKLRRVDSYTRKQVIEEVNRAVLMKPEPVVEPAGLLKWLEKMPPQEVAGLLAAERPQSVALVLAHLGPKGAADILSLLDEHQRNQIALRMSDMKAVSKEAIEAVDEAMRKRVAKAKAAPTAPNGSQTLARILGNASGIVRSSVMGALSHSDSPVCSQISAMLDSVEELVALPAERTREILKQVSAADICLVMRVASDELKDTIMSNLHEDTVRIVQMDMDGASQFTLGDMDSAQKRMLDVVRRIESGGQDYTEAAA